MAIDSPRSLAAYLLFVSDEHQQLLDLEVDPNLYDESAAFADDYLVTSFLSKYPYLNVDVDRKEKAKQKFVEYETLCGLTNKRWNDLLDRSSSFPDEALGTVFYNARAFILRVLGRSPNLEAISERFGWGPGATSAASGSKTSPYDKFQRKLEVTSNALIFGHCCVNSIPAWVNCQLQTDEFPSLAISLTRECFEIIRGNEIVYVPKNAKIDRIIAKEPHVNSFGQKGVGGLMRDLLKRVGLDLSDQTFNQRLAQLGSSQNTVATLDMSGASDCVATSYVRWSLPSRWFALCDSLRSKQGLFNGHWIYYNKFSSMGNAFTFELESLLFYSLTKSVAEYLGSQAPYNVYGDDIVVGVECVELLREVLTFAGFLVNEKKSFSSGRFRESCGKDYFDGTDVRPIFLKEKIDNAETLFKLANGIRRYSHSRNFYFGCDERFLPAYRSLVRRLPHHLSDLKIPEGYGDGGLVSNFDEAQPTIPPKKLGWGGYYYKVLQRRPVKRNAVDRHGLYASQLLVAGSEEPSYGFVTRRKETSLHIARAYTLEWYDLGAWQE
jgi:hypothetical protein